MARTLAPLAAVLLAAGLLAACSSTSAQPAASTWTPKPDGCPAAAGKPVTLVVGARMGSQRPQLPDPIPAMIEQAMAAGQKVQLIRLDGEPSVVTTVQPSLTATNTAKRENDLKIAEKRFFEAVATLQPKAPEADVLGALTEAGGVTDEGGTVVVVDSGIATAGQLTFRAKAMFGADPKDVTDSLFAQHQLPKLSKMSVVLVGLGKTAEPQAELDHAQQEHIAAIWQAVAARADAACTAVVPGQTHRDRFDTTVPVTTVDLPSDPPVNPCGTTVYDDSSAVGFVADQATFRDPDAAQRTLKQLVDKVSGQPVTMKLIGNTSSAGTSEPDRVALSQQRAQAVKAVLVRLGVPDGRITAEGDGSTGKYHAADRTANGSLDPVKATANRSVVVETSCSG